MRRTTSYIHTYRVRSDEEMEGREVSVRKSAAQEREVKNRPFIQLFETRGEIHSIANDSKFHSVRTSNVANRNVAPEENII